MHLYYAGSNSCCFFRLFSPALRERDCTVIVMYINSVPYYLILFKLSDEVCSYSLNQTKPVKEYNLSQQDFFADSAAPSFRLFKRIVNAYIFY